MHGVHMGHQDVTETSGHRYDTPKVLTLKHMHNTVRGESDQCLDMTHQKY